MTREQLQKHWPIIEAFKNGKKVQFMNTEGKWEDLPNPSFHTDAQYRIGWSDPYNYPGTLPLLDDNLTDDIVRGMDEVTKTKYFCNLWKIVNGESLPDTVPWFDMEHLLEATPLQKAEAICMAYETK